MLVDPERNAGLRSICGDFRSHHRLNDYSKANHCRPQMYKKRVFYQDTSELCCALMNLASLLFSPVRRSPPPGRQLNREAVRIRQLKDALAELSSQLIYSGFLSHSIPTHVGCCDSFLSPVSHPYNRPILFVSYSLYAKRNATVTTVSINVPVLTVICHGLKLAIGFCKLAALHHFAVGQRAIFGAEGSP